MTRTAAQAAYELFKHLPSWEVLFRAYRLWWYNKFPSEIDHEQIVGAVIEDGRMTSRYSFMVTMACAIAILGLLLSSPAVIIGAMLISPLMGPIMSLGFSLCIMDFKQMKKALEAIVIGMLLALMISSVIVHVSPLSDPTPEIMARTQPNLFDLLVAIFSGLAGGYATIRQKGGTIVGVAIATALMPPLAVVGYGISTASWPIAQGAFFLFMTNLLAISLSVTLIAKWYGFGTESSPKQTFWQTALVAGVFTLLSIPLGISLSKIAYQSYVTKTTKAELSAYFADTASQISNFSISFKTDNSMAVNSIMITDSYKPKAEKELQEYLEKKFGKTVNLSLNQIVMAKQQQEEVAQSQDVVVDTALANPAHSKLDLLNTQEEMAQTIKSSVFFPFQFVSVDAENDSVVVYPKPDKGLTLDILHNIEGELRARFPGWSVTVIPPVQPFPPVFFEMGKDDLAPLEGKKIRNIAWALRRWEITDIAVIGYASTVGEFEKFDNTSLAFRRAETVMRIFEQEKINALPKAEYRSFKQRQEEMNYGIRSLQRVEIRLIKPPIVLSEASPSTDIPKSIENATNNGLQSLSEDLVEQKEMEVSPQEKVE